MSAGGGGATQTCVTVLISSFDGYSDAWPGVCHGFEKYWPDCPYPVYLLTNKGSIQSPGIQMMPVEGGSDWSTRLKNAVRNCTSPFIMYFQEDYWITHPVDSAKMQVYAGYMEQHGWNYLRLVPNPQPDEVFPPDPRLGFLADGAPYRTSVQVSFWRREVLEELIVPGESVWQFEIAGTERSRKYGKTFLSTYCYGDDEYFHGIRYLCTAINAGKWYRPAHDYAEREGLKIDFSRRPTESLWEHYRRTTKWGRALGVGLHRLKLAATDPVEAAQRSRRRR